MEELISGAHGDDLEPPSEQGRYIILTSGTTGTPKGAQRSQPEGLSALAALFSKIPRRYGETAMIAAPLFHSWGFLHFMLSLPTAATMVLRPRFDPEDTLPAIAEHRARVLAVVPVMMQRILALPDEVKRRYDLSALEVTAASGSALPGELATKWMDEFGDNLYNLYGSTEVAWATIATPEDMRAAPGTAGQAAAGHGDPDRRRGRQRRPTGRDRADLHRQPARLRGLHRRRRQGAPGRPALLGRRRPLRRGRPPLHRRAGRRDDRLRRRERLPAERSRTCSPTTRRWHEAAAIGVDDEEFGQRLRAFVVKAEGEDASEDELKDYVKANLARYKVPREIVFVDELPRNATGKVLKRELAERQHAD